MQCDTENAKSCIIISALCSPQGIEKVVSLLLLIIEPWVHYQGSVWDIWWK